MSNSFVDRDMFMRYHGGGVGHCLSVGGSVEASVDGEVYYAKGQSDVGQPLITQSENGQQIQEDEESKEGDKEHGEDDVDEEESNESGEDERSEANSLDSGDEDQRCSDDDYDNTLDDCDLE
jgi:hypothetical protein